MHVCQAAAAFTYFNRTGVQFSRKIGLKTTCGVWTLISLSHKRFTTKSLYLQNMSQKRRKLSHTGEEDLPASFSLPIETDRAGNSCVNTALI